MSKIAPQLRFPEFTDEWQVKKLGDIGPVAMCKRILKDETASAGDVPFYKIGTFGRAADAFINKTTFQKYKNKYSFPKKGDILISAAGTVGRLVVYDGLPAYFQDSNIVWIANDENKVSNRFLFWCYVNTNWRTEDTTIARLYNDNLKSISIKAPSKPEQEKIADFLTAVDERIRLQEQKLAKLEQYKRGVMQQIFSQKIRFKDENGNEYPEWQEKRLGEVGKIITGKTPSTTDKSHWTGEVKFVTPTDMDGQKYQETSTRTVSYTGSLMLPEKSIMYTCIASIGKMSMSVGDTITNQQINSFIPSSKICNEFTYYNLLWLTPRIISTQSNNTLPIINKSEFSKFKVFLPSWEEQQKIATFLTALDDKITAEKSKLTAARQFKKALLQRMFV